MSFGNLIKKASENLNKNLEKGKVNKQLNQQGTEIKKAILSKLNLSDLVLLTRQLGVTKDYKGGEVDILTGQKTQIRKLNRFDYVDFLANKPYKKLSELLRISGKTRLADELETDIEDLIGRADNKIKKIYQGPTQEENQELDVYIEKISESITSIRPEKAKNEREYQIELSGMLKGLKYKFEGKNFSVTREKKTKTNRFIDIMINVGGYRVAVETKYSPNRSGEIQRAFGQGHIYSNFANAYILVSYAPIENKTFARELISLKNSLQVPAVIIANGRILR